MRWQRLVRRGDPRRRGRPRDGPGRRRRLLRSGAAQPPTTWPAYLDGAVSDNTASAVSNSWGEPTYVTVDGTVYPTIDQTLVDAYESVFLQGAVQGIGFYYSSGDNGDEGDNTGVVSPDWPAADPWVTAVGGTALAVDRHGRRQFETGWGTERYSLTNGAWTSDGFLYGAGGGCSDIFAKPFYQYLASTGCAKRAVPDVAMDADPTTGMLVGETQVFDLPTRYGQGTRYGEYRIGGTSLAAPLFAGVQADAQQGRRRIGFADPLLYLLGKVPGVFHDVRPEGDPGNVRVDFVNGLNADRRPALDGPDLRRGLQPDHRSRLGRRHRGRLADRAVPLGGLPALTREVPAPTGPGRRARPGPVGTSGRARAVERPDDLAEGARCAGRRPRGVVSGHMRAMLWNGVMRMPRLTQREVQVGVEVLVVRGGRLLAGARGRAREAVLRARPEPAHRGPRHVVGVEDVLHPLGEVLGQGGHVGEGVLGEHLAEGRPHRGDASALPARVPDPADVDDVGLARSSVWPRHRGGHGLARCRTPRTGCRRRSTCR